MHINDLDILQDEMIILNPTRENVFVTADGVKTYRQLLNELWTLVDLSRVTSYSKAQVFNLFLPITNKDNAYLHFSCWDTVSNGYAIDLNANTSNFARVNLSNAPSITFTDRYNEVPPAGNIIKIIY